MKVVQSNNHYYIQLRRSFGNVALAGPFENVPLIVKEIVNNEGFFYDLAIGPIKGHIIYDHSGQEYLLTELEGMPQEVSISYSEGSII